MDIKKYATLKERFLRYVKFNTRSDEANATLPSNIDKKVATVGFIAHMDTADFNNELCSQIYCIKSSYINIGYPIIKNRLLK